MQPVHFDFNKNLFPVYYSLQNPATHEFSSKSRKISSTLFEMRELAHILKTFKAELSKAGTLCADTILGDGAKQTQFSYFHNKVDPHNILRLASDLANFDKRFIDIKKGYKLDKAVFAADAPFVRGCISISSKNISSNN
jgi:hypothetical protein